MDGVISEVNVYEMDGRVSLVVVLPWRTGGREERSAALQRRAVERGDKER